MKKPVEAIERILYQHKLTNNSWAFKADWKAVIDFAQSIPDDAIPVVWPAELTRERLYMLAANRDCQEKEDALRALAAIAPVRKKRTVNLWSIGRGSPLVMDDGHSPVGESWRKVAGPVEIDE